MTKYDFEDWLRHRLSDLPQDELDRIAAFYMDAIEARMEDGMTEEQAIYDLGEPEALLEEIRADLPEYGTVTYRPVRKGRQTANRRKWLAAGVTAAAACTILLVAFTLIINFSRPVHSVTPIPEPRIVESTLPTVSVPQSNISFDAATLEKVAIAAAGGNVQVEPSEDGTVHIIGDPALYEAVRRGNTLYVENVEADFILQIPDHLKLEIKCDAGSVVLYEIVPPTLSVYCDLGNIALHNVSALHSITLEADCGSIEGSLRGTKTDYEIDVNVDVDVGTTNLSDSYHSGDEEIKLTASADFGNVFISFEE